MDRTYLEARIVECKALIEAWEDVLTAFAANSGIQSYTFDSGQTRQVVSRTEIGSINRVIDSLMNRCVTMEARLNGSGVVNVRPGW